jgi:hypothetical protein
LRLQNPGNRPNDLSKNRHDVFGLPLLEVAEVLERRCAGGCLRPGVFLCFRGRVRLIGGAMARWFTTLFVSFAACASLTAAPGVRTDRVDEAVARGVAFLLSQQLPEGAFVDKERGNQHQTVMTGLALMSLASVGHLPTDPTLEGDAMRKAIDFLCRDDRQASNGYFGNTDGSRMYGHGITTLALCEMLGMGVNRNQDRILRERATRAIELILRSQRVSKHSVRYEGGWRYTPDSGDADLSVSVWQAMALRSAKNAGLAVPKEAIDKAVQYLKNSYASSRDAQGLPTNLRTGFAYQPGGNAEFATTAAGLLALQVCGEYEGLEVRGASDWLLEMLRGDGGGRRQRNLSYDQKWFFYGTYYFAQGMQKRGGEHAREARQFTEQILLANQQGDGAWISADGQERGAGRIYSTSLAILSLSIKHHYLPIYQY